MKKNIIYLITICMLVSGCMTYEPKPGMTARQFDRMSVLSGNGNIVYVGDYDPVPGVKVYENWKQTDLRTTGVIHGDDGEYYFFYNGKLVAREWVLNQQTEKEKKQARLIQQQKQKLASQKLQLELKKIELKIKQEEENLKKSRPIINE